MSSYDTNQHKRIVFRVLTYWSASEIMFFVVNCTRYTFVHVYILYLSNLVCTFHLTKARWDGVEEPTIS